VNHHYADIREKLGEPQWWDEVAVPRYCEFSPDATASIYAKEACLVRIECQGCRTPFRVCFTSDGTTWVAGNLEQYSLAGAVKRGAIHYGDPPNAGCCPAGPTMNSIPRRVLEFWRKDSKFNWERAHELEVDLDCDWANDA
jgi:hypothetical protein